MAHKNQVDFLFVLFYNKEEKKTPFRFSNKIKTPQ